MPIECGAAKVAWVWQGLSALSGLTPAMNTRLYSPLSRPVMPPTEPSFSEKRGTAYAGDGSSRFLSEDHCNGAMGAAASVGANGGLGGSILVVDDDEAVRDVLASMLRGCRFTVSCAHDGEHGWSTLVAGNFDLLITDHSMPMLTGVNLLRRLRAKMNPMPAILVSGCMPWEEPDLDYLLRPGLALEKPFSFYELLGGIQKLVTKSAGA
jgi:CheY-like chemotaxis protein